MAAITAVCGPIEVYLSPDTTEVRRQDDVLWLQRKEMSDVLGPLTDLSRIVSSSRPVGSVDVEQIVDKRG